MVKFHFKNIKKDTIYFFLLMGILMLPNIFVFFHFEEIQGSFKMLTGYIILSILVWLFPLTFLKKKVYFWIGLFFLLLSPLEIFFVKDLGAPINSGFLDAILKTNFQESAEQIVVNSEFLFLFIPLLFLYLFLLLKIKNEWIDKKWRVGILIAFLGFNLVLFIKMYSILTKPQSSVSDKVELAFSNTLSKYSKIYPSDLVINLGTVFKQRRMASQLKKKIKEFTFGAQSGNKEETSEIYVLVIGETSRFYNYHLNGYFRETSPNLDTLSNLISFQNVSAGANLTSRSIPSIITRATPLHPQLKYQEKTILDAFEEADYFTSWITNQNSRLPIINRLKDVADVFVANYSTVNSKGFYDGNILPKFENLVSHPTKKKFIVIHTLGSHFRYENRYPENFKKYTPVLGGTSYEAINISNKQKIINAYDNSILYTDYFISQLIQILKETNENAVLIFLSDHGENLFDNGLELNGHGAENPTKYVYHIPYFIWYSDSFYAANPKKVEQLKGHQFTSASSNTTFYTLLDLANIQYKGAVEGVLKSLASKKYKIPQQRYILNGSGEPIEIE